MFKAMTTLLISAQDMTYANRCFFLNILVYR